MNSLIRTSILTISLLFSFLFTIILLIAYYTDSLNLYYVIGITIIVNFILWLVSPTISDFIYSFFYKCTFYKKEEFAQNYPQIYVFVEKVCNEYKFPIPKLGIIHDNNPTAFTYGSHQGNARIVITEGISHYLNEQEVRAVIAHELGHIYHRDFIVMTIATTLLQILYEIYVITSRTRSRNSKKNPLAVIGLISFIFYFIGTYIVLFLSRTREYYADWFSAQVTKAPHDLIQALVKIAYGIVQAEDSEKAKRLMQSTRALGVIDINNAKNIGAIIPISTDPKAVAKVMSFDLLNPWAFFLELKSTHPLTGKRIYTLEKAAVAMGQTKIIDIETAVSDFKSSNNAMYSGFYMEVFVSALPVILALVGFLLAGLPGVLIGIGTGILCTILFSMPEKNNVPSTIYQEMATPMSSPVRGKAIMFEGQIIGKGSPGYMFSEDMMFQDKTGLIYLDFQHLFGFIGNIFFSMGKVEKLIGKQVKIEGWFFRGIMPMIRLKKIYVDNEIINSRPRLWPIIISGLLIISSILLLLLSLSAV